MPPKKQSRKKESASSSQPSVSKSIFGRENRLDGIFSQEEQQSQPDSNKTSSKKRKPFEEDEGFFYKRTNASGSESRTEKGGKNEKKRSKLSTPVSKLNQALGDLPGQTDDFYAMDYGQPSTSEKSKKTRKPRPKSKKGKPSKKDLDLGVPEPVKLSSPIRPRFEGTYQEPSLSSSDEYVEQVSHHKIDLTGGSSDFEESITSNKTKSKRPKKKSDRRSSYQNRGKRMSSIGNGLVALPHEDVTPKDYYKLLDSSLPEPHRMKQLLIWCISKNMEDEKTKQSSDDLTTKNIAKVIKEEVLKDLRDGSVSTSWYHKPAEDEDGEGIIANKEIMLPNPLNLTTAENIKHFSKQLTKLRKEKEQWKDLYKRNLNAVNKKLIPFDNVTIDTTNTKDAKTFENYCKQKTPDFSNVANESVFHDIESVHKDVTDKFSDNIENSIDELYNLTNKLTKVSQLIDHYKHEKLDPKVSEFTHNYINKSRFDQSSLTDQSGSIWPVPPADIGIKKILQGIAKIEYQQKQRQPQSQPQPQI